MFGGFFPLFIGVPIGLAVVLGLLFPHKPVQAGLSTVGLLAVLLLIVNWSHGIIPMLPFTFFVSAMAIVPAILSAYFGAGLRLRRNKEN